MITVTAKYVHLLSEVAGRFGDRLLVEEGTTVGRLLEQHIQRYGYGFRRWVVLHYPDRERPVINIQVNGRGINHPLICPEGMDLVLQDGDEVVFGGLSGAA
ncbi:MAG: MoaD/ThiS family protein [Deltaproteobacteria bacterium]|nr:MoaD/ThiS family protein [Deltaproteobacteria bacterium]